MHTSPGLSIRTPVKELELRGKCKWGRRHALIVVDTVVEVSAEGWQVTISSLPRNVSSDSRVNALAVAGLLLVVLLIGLASQVTREGHWGKGTAV